MVKFNYYYNNVPNKGLCRNNLIYTSLISNDKKTFCQWYHNDSEYHKNQNEVVDSDKMQEKWEREVKFLTSMSRSNSDLVPDILDIDYIEKKIYLSIDGVDFWQRSLDKNNCPYEDILPDWQDQMINIVKSHRLNKWWKYSMHPSSYFIVNRKLKSINYFFTYNENEKIFSIKDVESHIHSNRQSEMKIHLTKLGIDWNKPQSFSLLNKLCWESFRSNYPDNFINEVSCII